VKKNRMKKRYIFGIYMIVTCVLLNIGLCSKHKYIDLNAEKRHLYHLVQFPDTVL